MLLTLKDYVSKPGFRELLYETLVKVLKNSSFDVSFNGTSYHLVSLSGKVLNFVNNCYSNVSSSDVLYLYNNLPQLRSLVDDTVIKYGPKL